ncbi:MAG: 50S ribosomal protein L1 [Candidatus Omnitrophica bacterium]|nr:50S ribosomal protein L1 [Candidatus Omnitrophota bacterium]
MKKRSKKYKAIRDRIEKKIAYTPEEVIAFIKANPSARFDETVELSVHLGLDLKKIQQPIRGSVNLPHGSGKQVKVLVFAQGENVEKAKNAGADYYGGNELIEKIKNGWLDFQAVVATPDMMKNIAVLGKILGPRGLMPNPKSGTVTFDIDKIVTELKKGRIEFKMDKDGNIHIPIGKVSFSSEQLLDNFYSALKAIIAAKPQGAKGVYIKSVYLSSTMGPSFPINITKIAQEIKSTMS